MLKLAAKAHSTYLAVARTAADRVAGRRGLTLVEYVLGAAFVAAIALFLGPRLISLAQQAWNNIDAAFRAS